MVNLTGAPALTAHVIDSDTVDTIGLAGRSGRWRACLAREAMGGYASDESLGLDEEFLPAVDAAVMAAEWAKEAALQPDAQSLQKIFQRDNAELLAEDMSWEFWATWAWWMDELDRDLKTIATWHGRPGTRTGTSPAGDFGPCRA